MTHKPAVGRGGFGRNKPSKLSDNSVYIASAAPSSSPETPSRAQAAGRAVRPVDPVVILVAPVGRGRFRASFDGRLLVESSTTPFLDAAPVLAGEGIDPATKIVMRHAGSQTDALIATVGGAAKLMVEEGHGVPRFRRWRPSPYGRGTPGSVSDEVAAITTVEALAASTAAPPTDVHRAIDADRHQTAGGSAAHDASEPAGGSSPPPQSPDAPGGAAGALAALEASHRGGCM